MRAGVSKSLTNSALLFLGCNSEQGMSIGLGNLTPVGFAEPR